MPQLKIAIVTGASSGIGREFVKRLDLRGDLDEIWVIARRADRLAELATLSNTKITPISLDLSDDRADAEISYILADRHPDVRVLVNAAGYGKFGAFTDLPCSEQMGMIELNQGALVRMTYRVLPYMSAGSEIYQIGSLSAFQPVPYMSIYAATKAFVLSFSRALGKELEKSNIRVLAVCPGWVRTEFFDRAVVEDGVIVYFNKFFTPEQIVDRAFRDMKRGRDVSVCGFSIRAQVLLTKILPHKLVMKIWCAQQKK